MALHHELAFWVAVGLVAVVAVVLFKVIFAKVPFPPLQTVAAAI